MFDQIHSRLILHRLEREVGQVGDHVFQLGQLDNHGLKGEIAKGRVALRRATGFRMARRNTERARAVALLALASERELGIRPSPTQMLATLAMHEGHAFQLDLADGRNLAVAMAAILYAWGGHPCHIVSTSEYLAKRDAMLMQPLFVTCGCSVAAIAHDTPVEEISRCYEVDLLYATGRQLLSDFMRDHVLVSGVSGSLRRRLWELRAPLDARRPVMKGTFVAIVDDVGTVLIDEATSPMVISAPGKSSVLDEVTQIARAQVENFQPDRDFVVKHEPNVIIEFTAEGERRLAECASALPSFWRLEKRCQDAMTAAILARDVIQLDRHYYVRQQRVVMLEENIQKLLSGQSWYLGVIQAIEAREGLALTIPPRTVARTAFQEFFPRYRRLSGSGSELSQFRRELWRSYRLRLLCITTRATGRFEVVHRYDFADRAEKMAAMIETVDQLQRDRLPVLVGVRRILDIVEIVARLSELGINCNVLEGKDPESDARLLSIASGAGCVTIVTGLAGRGLDIAEDSGVVTMAGVQVLLFEHHETRRADRLFLCWADSRRSPGAAQYFASLDDELLVTCPPLVAATLRFFAKWSKYRGRCIAGLVYFSQRAISRQTARHRGFLLLREAQLDQQLAFFKKLYHDSAARF